MFVILKAKKVHMNYSAIFIVQEKIERKALEFKIQNVESLFNEVVVVSRDVASLYYLKQAVVAPHFDSEDFLNHVYTGLSCVSNEWSFVCTDKYELATDKIKKMKGYLSKSQVVLWDENAALGFYRRHSLSKMEKLLRDKLGIEDFLKKVRVRRQ